MTLHYPHLHETCVWRLHLTTLSIFCCVTWSLYLFATTDQGGSVLDAGLTILHQFVQVGFVVLRAVVSGAVQWITNLHLIHLFNLTESTAKL